MDGRGGGQRILEIKIDSRYPMMRIVALQSIWLIVASPAFQNT